MLSQSAIVQGALANGTLVPQKSDGESKISFANVSGSDAGTFSCEVQNGFTDKGGLVTVTEDAILTINSKLVCSGNGYDELKLRINEYQGSSSLIPWKLGSA